MKALITGATGGFGRVLCEVFADNGYTLWIHGRDAQKLHTLKEELEEEYMTNVYVICGDIKKEDTLELLAGSVETHNIDVVINNAAIYTEAIQDSIMTNAIAPIYFIEELIFMNKPMTIVNINSVAGLRGNPNEAAYCASKFALRGYSESVKFSAIKKGIRIVDVYLGAMSVGMGKGRGTIDPVEAAELIVDVIETKSFIPEIRSYRE